MVLRLVFVRFHTKQPRPEIHPNVGAFTLQAADIATEVEGKKAEILTKWVD